MDAVSRPFPLSRGRDLGYDPREVDAYLAEARRQYADDGAAAKPLTSTAIRHASFAMQRDGYSPGSVDAALERLEDAFALRERERAVAARGEVAWLAEARATSEVLQARLRRPDGERFTRAGALTRGYSPDEVDRFARRLARYLREERSGEVDEVRTIAFRTRRGGYDEAQVDMLLDAAIDVLLALR
jgi:DivIVA domain-containing protein